MPSHKLQTKRSISGDEIVDQARLWVGTRYHHQAARRGLGVDCVGLVTGVGRELDQWGPDFATIFKSFDGYSRTPNPVRMREGLELFMRPAAIDPGARPPPGVVGWFEWRAELPMHLAIMADFEGRSTMIHAYSLVDRCVEHTFDETWQSRINSFWTYPGMQI